LAGLRQEFLNLLREDEEFRLAVAGLLGLEATLSELKKLREDFLGFVKKQEKRWEENNKRWEENNKRWEENNKRWEENNKRWEEAFKRFEELEKRTSRVELGLGALTEVTLTRYVWEDVREDAKLRGEKITTRQRSATINGHEVDMLIETERGIYVVEVKVKPTIDDLKDLLTKAEIVQRRYEKPTIPILAGTLIGDEVKAFAKGKNVEVYSY
jgi:predicted nuclease with TOPRIM domain